MKVFNSVLFLIVCFITVSSCDHGLSPGTLVKGRVVLEVSNEPISNAAIIIRQYHSVPGSIPQNSILLSQQTIPCDEEGDFYHRIDREDSASHFSIKAAIWDSALSEYTEENTLCYIGDWISCNGLTFGQVYEDYILEIPDSE